MNDTKKRDFVVVTWFSSSAIFEKDHALIVTTPRQNDAPVEITFTTRHLNRGFEIDVPGCIQAVAKGTEANVNIAAESFSSFANLTALTVSVASNAWVALPEVALSYDNTPGENEHEFLQVHVPEEPFEYVANRRIPTDLVQSLIRTLGALTEPHRNLIMRAAVQYREALRYWKPGQETMVLSHLFRVWRRSSRPHSTGTVQKRVSPRNSLANHGAIETTVT